MNLNCKFISKSGAVLGSKEVPPHIGVVCVKDKDGVENYFGRMVNGDKDKKLFPFIFAQSDLYTNVTGLDKIDVKPQRTRKQPKARTTRTRKKRSGRLHGYGRVD